MAPFLRSSIPFWKKGGRKGGKYTKKGGIDTDRRQYTDTENTAGNTAVYNSSEDSKGNERDDGGE